MAKAKIKTKKITTIDDLKTTIDDLTVVVSDGFSKVADNFKKQEKATDKKIGNLAIAMDEGFKKQEKAFDEKIDNLAVITMRGFDKAAENLEVVKTDVHFLKYDMQEVKEKVGNIEKLILQQHSFQIKELESKVRHIEEALAMDK